MKSSKAILIAAILYLVVCHPAVAECNFESQPQLAEELNLPIHAWRDDKCHAPKGIIVAVPGLIFSGFAYDSLARYSSDRQFHVYSIDLRGIGEWRNPNSKFSEDSTIHFTQSKEDISKLLEALRRKYPDAPIHRFSAPVWHDVP